MRLYIASIVLLALMVRIWGISEYSFNPDEMQFLIIAQGNGLLDIWQRGLSELHPPLFHFVHHYQLMISDNVFIQRLFSVLYGMIALLGFYRLGLIFKDKYFAAILLLFAAFSTIAISISITFRDYGIFLDFLIFALIYWIKYNRNQKNTDLAIFALLMFLACASNFSGFLIAAACGITQGLSLLRRKNWKNLIIFSSVFLPILTLGILFYFNFIAVGTVGYEWKKRLLDSSHIATDISGKANRVFMGIATFLWLGMDIIDLKYIADHQWLPGLIMGSSFVVFAMYIKGLNIIRRQEDSLFYLIIAVWIIAIIAQFADLYPIVGTRHGTHLVIFFLLPFAYLLREYIGKIGKIFLLLPIAASFYVAIFIWGDVGLKISDEFAIKRQDFEQAQSRLNAEIKPGDLIISGGYNGYAYLLYDKDRGKTSYADYQSVPYINDSIILAPYDSVLLPYDKILENFYKLLSSNSSQNGANNFWFVVYGWKNSEIFGLFNCPTTHEEIENIYSEPGVLIFSVKQSVIAKLVQDKDAFAKCYVNHRPIIVTAKFGKVNYSISPFYLIK
ncbi:MAG: hypothetical protein WCL30_00860 [Pseudomonadota bacterium]